MPRGGKRDGSGRKKGAATKKTREIANKVASEGGLSMLELMVRNARHWQVEAEAAEAVLAELRVNPSDEDAVEILKSAVKKAVGYRELATNAADKCARFLHPILSPVDGKPRDAEFVPLQERLVEYERRDAIEDSGGKVVDLKRRSGK